MIDRTASIHSRAPSGPDDRPASPATEPVTPDEVRALRARMNATPEQFAATLAVGEREVRAWEAGTLRVPRHEGAWIRHLLASHAREDAAAEAGIVDCAWMTAQQERFHVEAEKGNARAFQPLAREMERHTASCPDCARVRAWLETQPPLPPLPRPRGVGGLFAAFVEWVDGLPAWARPAAHGAALIGGITLLRAVVVLLMRGGRADALGTAAMGVAVGAGLGAVGGVTWQLVHRPLRALGRAAPYVTGMVVAAVCVLAMAAFLALVHGARIPLTQAGGWVMGVLALMTVVGGLVIGHVVLRGVDEPVAREP